MLTSCELPELRAKPAIDLAPPAAHSDGWDAARLAAGFGLEQDDWQKHALIRSLGRHGGRWASPEVGLEVPRQNGKTVILQVRALWELWGVEGPRLVVWTAHEAKTAREAFLDLRGLIEDSPMAPDVRSIRTFPNMEVELRDGSRVIFLARTSGSGRGFSGDLVILDEAYALSTEQMAALMPTLSARPDPQLWYASMAGLQSSEHLRRVRDRAVAGGEGLAYLAWSAVAPGGEGLADLDDRDGWLAANPSAPHRITLEAIAQERESLPADVFARERLGIWDAGAASSIIDADVWAGLADPQSAPGETLAFGVAMPWDRSVASIAVASRRADGVAHVELVPCCKVHARADGRCGGTVWVPDRVAELHRRWRPNGTLLDTAGPAGPLILPITNAGVEPTLVGSREVAQACGAFYDAVMASGLAHRGQPELAMALEGAQKRSVGDAWAWQRKDSSVDISPLEAVTLALHGLNKPPKRRPKTGRMMSA